MREKPGFVHTVYFWVNDDVSEEQKASFHQGVKELSKCKTIATAYFGPPAGTPREVVDNTYDYALTVFFKNKADHDIYQNDPDHFVFINAFQGLWKKVQVYDHIPD